MEKKGKEGGFKGYIKEVLIDKGNVNSPGGESLSDSEKWAAARLACDIFLTDKYTKWEYMVNKEGEKTQFKPSPDWGGDPLRALLEPSFLPRRIKQVYEETPEILDFIDEAFLPKDMFFSEEAKSEGIAPLNASISGVKLKDYARWNKALWIFLGGSRAGGIANWSPDAGQKSLTQIAELLDDVYGKKGKKTEREARYLSKEIAGAMMTRIVKAKAAAVLRERARPTFKDQIAIFFGSKKGVEEAFTEVEVFLFGPDRDCSKGFFSELVGGREGFVLKDNRFGAEADINETGTILFAASSEKRDIVMARTLHLLSYGWSFLVSMGKNVRV